MANEREKYIAKLVLYTGYLERETDSVTIRFIFVVVVSSLK